MVIEIINKEGTFIKNLCKVTIIIVVSKVLGHLKADSIRSLALASPCIFALCRHSVTRTNSNKPIRNILKFLKVDRKYNKWKLFLHFLSDQLPFNT